MRTFLQNNILKFCFIFFVCSLSLTPFLSHAGMLDEEAGASAAKNAPGSYTPIVDIPGLNGNTLSTEGYIQALYYLSITVAALLAVFKILVAGIQWMFSDVVTQKEAAKKNIQGALFGLLIVLSAVLILETINGNLTNLNILGNAPSLNDIEGGSTSGISEVRYRDTLSSAHASAAEIEQFHSSCPGVTTNTTISANRAGATQTLFTCYANPDSIIAKPGDTYDPTIYPPGTDETHFEQSCSNTGGVYDVYGKSCINRSTTTKFKSGDTVVLGSLSDSERISTINTFKKDCPTFQINTIESTIACP